jgi:methylated-DNA-protein-cysteine methyltransferase-like protein
MPRSAFTSEVIDIIRAIPRGRVATYGGIARLAGSPRAARQVVRVLHTYRAAEELPWHRVINSRGCIGLPRAGGFEEQSALLLAEHVAVDGEGRVDLSRYLWEPED